MKNIKIETKNNKEDINLNKEIKSKVEDKRETSSSRVFNPTNTLIQSKNNNNLNENKISLTIKRPSEKKVQKMLKNGGMIHAYRYLMESLCKNGLPTGDLFEYSAYTISNYEKKWKQIKAKEVKEKIIKYREEIGKDLEDENINVFNKLNKSLDEDRKHHTVKKSITDLKRSQSSKKRLKSPKQNQIHKSYENSQSPKNKNKTENKINNTVSKSPKNDKLNENHINKKNINNNESTKISKNYDNILENKNLRLNTKESNNIPTESIIKNKGGRKHENNLLENGHKEETSNRLNTNNSNNEENIKTKINKNKK